MCRRTSSIASILGKEQITSLVNDLVKCPEPSLIDIVLIGIETGMRPTDIADLKWTDIDFERKIISGRGPNCPIALSDLMCTRLAQVRAKNPNTELLFGQDLEPLISDLRGRFRRVLLKLDLSAAYDRLVRLASSIKRLTPIV